METFLRNLGFELKKQNYEATIWALAKGPQQIWVRIYKEHTDIEIYDASVFSYTRARVQLKEVESVIKKFLNI